MVVLTGRALQTPSLLLYGSGRIISQDPGDPADQARTPPPRLIPLAVARLVAQCERSGLLTADYDVLPVTDLPSTRVWSHGATGSQEVSVYGLSESFDEYASILNRRRRKQFVP